MAPKLRSHNNGNNKKTKQQIDDNTKAIGDSRSSAQPTLVIKSQITSESFYLQIE